MSGVGSGIFLSLPAFGGERSVERPHRINLAHVTWTRDEPGDFQGDENLYLLVAFVDGTAIRVYGEARERLLARLDQLTAPGPESAGAAPGE